jgi:hypothetical protein
MTELELRIGAREDAERGVECSAKWTRGSQRKGPKTTRSGCLCLQKTGNSMEKGRWDHVVIVTFLVVFETLCQLHITCIFPFTVVLAVFNGG